MNHEKPHDTETATRQIIADMEISMTFDQESEQALRMLLAPVQEIELRQSDATKTAIDAMIEMIEKSTH